jgi:putative heme-binding domain-containing protein
MKSLFALPSSVLAALLAVNAAQPVDPFAEGVRPTDPLTAEDQLKTFKLPPGFQIQLVAAEPDLQKPMNMAFDSKGRLWVTMSREYPFPAPLDKPARDMIKVFEDFDENGRARKITTFADGLNIPIGLYPYKNGVIAWSIPNIWFFQDTDGDGKADKRDVLFGPFGWERDTHGNQASFRRGFDGWLYATHGFNNISHVRARDGSEVRMHSGNTYRMRLDGSRIEHHTFGQVNPFGMCFDPSGNMYTADCHSAPIYELLRGGYYPSFGKPHDGLGFAPTMLEHSHGSTAICGIIFYADDQWPAEYQNNILIGNVMTSRINRDTLLPRGSSKTAREEKDFLTTTDPWFRPVDLQLGPDGALYVADFYNRIIGHYEVPLTHPGRDFERARIWKISYTGEGKSPGKLPDFSRADVTQLLTEFRSANLPRRMLAMNELIDRHASAALPQLQTVLNKRDAAPTEIVHSLWALHRLDSLDQETLRNFAAHSDRDVRVHTMRILSEHEDFSSIRQTAALRALQDADATVQRAAADALGQFPEPEVYVRPLLNALTRVPKEDDHLQHTLRLSLRNQLKDGGAALTYRRYKIEDAQTIADICLAIPHPDAATFLLDHIQSAKPSGGKLSEYVRHAARHTSEESLGRLTAYIRQTYANDPDDQLSFFKAIQEGSAQRGLQLTPEFRTWGHELAGSLLNSASSDNSAWRNLPVAGKPASANPWFLQIRESSDGDKSSTFLCSLPPGGEHLTGILRSKSFEVPDALSFYIAGHDGIPSDPARGNNLIRLVAADSGKTLIQSAPPRNDIAQPVRWNLSPHKGIRAYLEIVDADTGNAYAWLAVGRFDPPIVDLPKTNPNQIAARVKNAADIAKSLQLSALAPDLGNLLSSDLIDTEAQASLASALVALEPNEHRVALAPLLGDATIPADLRHKIARILSAGKSANSLEVLIEAMRTVPARGQLKLAQSLAGSAAGAETLLAMVEKRQASPQVLFDRGVLDKINALNSPSLKARHAKLTENLEPPSEAIQRQIDALRAKFAAATGSAIDGAKVFTQNCSVCHQIDGTGTLIGPQLDGIGGRGLERILEDTLDPNRNVDINFRTHIIILKDGDVVSGLFRREEGELLILADSTGKEISIPKSEIESRRESETSLMPANFGDIIPEKEFQDLMAFLLSKGVPRGEK